MMFNLQWFVYMHKIYNCLPKLFDKLKMMPMSFSWNGTHTASDFSPSHYTNPLHAWDPNTHRFTNTWYKYFSLTLNGGWNYSCGLWCVAVWEGVTLCFKRTLSWEACDCLFLGRIWLEQSPENAGAGLLAVREHGVEWIAGEFCRMIMAIDVS